MKTLPISVVLGPGPGWRETLADLQDQDGTVELWSHGPATDQPGVHSLACADSPGAVFLAGCTHATRPLVAWAPAGSRMAPDRLSRQLHALAHTGDGACVCWSRAPASPPHMRVTPALLFTGETVRSSVMLSRAHLPALDRIYPHADGLPVALAARVALQTSGAVTVLKAPLVHDAPSDFPEETALAALGAALDVLAGAPANALQQQIVEALVHAALPATRRWVQAHPPALRLPCPPPCPRRSWARSP